MRLEQASALRRMSSERHTHNEQSPNSIPREQTELTIQIASRALATICDNVCRHLVNENSR